MNQNLIDYELKEDRKGQTQCVEQDGSNRNVHKEPPFPQQIGSEPAKSEGRPLVGTIAIPFNQHRVAYP